MISRAEMLRNMQAMDIDAENLAKQVATDAMLAQIYYTLMPAQLRVIHLDDPEFAHGMMADRWLMLSCPYCHEHLHPNSPEWREAENAQGAIEV